MGRSISEIELAYKYGFADQSHMVNGFKVHYSMGIKEARKVAFNLDI